MSYATIVSPKPSFWAPWTVGDAAVGRRNAGWTKQRVDTLPMPEQFIRVSSRKDQKRISADSFLISQSYHSCAMHTVCSHSLLNMSHCGSSRLHTVCQNNHGCTNKCQFGVGSVQILISKSWHLHSVSVSVYCSVQVDHMSLCAAHSCLQHIFTNPLN